MLRTSRPQVDAGNGDKTLVESPRPSSLLKSDYLPCSEVNSISIQYVPYCVVPHRTIRCLRCLKDPLGQLCVMGPRNHNNNNSLHLICRRITLVTEDSRETLFLFQRLSIALQRGNAVSFLSTFTATD